MNGVKKLYRSKTNKIFAGVCGGLAEYLGADPTIVRFVWILLTLMGGSGLLLYIIAYLIMPNNPDETIVESTDDKKAKMRAIAGALLVFLGIVLLLDTLHIFSFRELWSTSWEYILPSSFIIIGLALLVRRKKETSTQPSTEQKASEIQENIQQDNVIEKLTRSVTDKKILGICGGIAEYFSIDSTIVRLLYILFIFATGGVGVIVYFLLGLVIPKKIR